MTSMRSPSGQGVFPQGSTPALNHIIVSIHRRWKYCFCVFSRSSLVPRTSGFNITSAALQAWISGSSQAGWGGKALGEIRFHRCDCGKEVCWGTTQRNCNILQFLANQPEEGSSVTGDEAEAVRLGNLILLSLEDNRCFLLSQAACQFYMRQLWLTLCSIVPLCIMRSAHRTCISVGRWQHTGPLVN